MAGLSVPVPHPEHAKATFDCPHCGARSVHLLRTEPPTYTVWVPVKDNTGKFHTVQVQRKHLIYRCINCEKDTYVLHQDEAKVYRSTGAGAGLVGSEPAQIVHRFPIITPVSHPSVPAELMQAAIEAEKCLAVGAPNACGCMTRRAIHALCENKGAKGADLKHQLSYLKDTNAITPDLWQWAEELRIVGRSGAHPEWEDVSLDEADYAVRFLREIIRYVYINPAERAARRLKETKQKK
jgi:DNA-directed RNA polymerase subunit RPC12/RpoP